ncbi:MAG: hypothetical protein E7450_06355 [Ruminococcaceae bacterium]|nr:hypothetical protein [Oscillospiraceae bacterium]
MMRENIDRELERYGRAVTVYTPQYPEGAVEKVMLQPERTRGTARAVPSPLGWKKQGRFIYLGPAHVPLEGKCGLEAEGVRYSLRNARPVYAGGELTHWWAVLEEAWE